MSTQITSEQLLAALQSGVAPESLDAGSNAPAAEPVVETPTPVVEAAPVAETPKAEAPTDFVAYLKSEVATLKADVAAKDAKLAALQTEVTSLKASSSPRLLDIVRTACTRQSIALNSTLIGVENLQGEALADQWVKLDEAITQKFKVGVQSRAAADLKPEQTPVTAIGGPRAGKTSRLP